MSHVLVARIGDEARYAGEMCSAFSVHRRQNRSARRGDEELAGEGAAHVGKVERTSATVGVGHKYLLHRVKCPPHHRAVAHTMARSQEGAVAKLVTRSAV